MKEMIKEEGSIQILKILGSMNNTEEYHKIYNHIWRKHKQSFRLNNIDKTRNCLIEEIKKKWIDE